jgi:hypothetical protein
MRRRLPTAMIGGLEPLSHDDNGSRRSSGYYDILQR